MTSTGPILFCIIQCPFTRKAMGRTFRHRPVKERNLILSNHMFLLLEVRCFYLFLLYPLTRLA